MFDIGIGEFLIIAVLALLVFGPDRLPRATAQAAAMIRQLRDQAASARQEITSSIDLESSGLKDLADLHPKRIMRTVLDPVESARADVTDAVSGANGSPTRPAGRAASPAAPVGPDTVPPDSAPPTTASPTASSPTASSPTVAPPPAAPAADPPPAFDPDAT